MEINGKLERDTILSIYFKCDNIREPGPPTFKKSTKEMQQLAAGYMGHRIELFCPVNRGSV